MWRVCSMYRERRFVSGFGKTDGRTDRRTTGGRADWPDGRPDGLAEDGRTRGRAADARKSRAAARRPTAQASAREKREREKEGEGREREALQRRRFPGASLHTSHQSHRHPKREERGRVRVRRFVCVTERCGSDGEERGAPAQILSKESSVAS
jgi:hypothetical protein